MRIYDDGNFTFSNSIFQISSSVFAWADIILQQSMTEPPPTAKRNLHYFHEQILLHLVLFDKWD